MGRAKATQSNLLVARNVEPDKTGLPRPFAKDAKGDKYPVPFSSWSKVHADKPIFSKFDTSSIMAFVESDFNICDTCGMKLGKDMIFGLQDTPAYINETDDDTEATVSGLPMHPRCALLAAAYCPHFKAWDEDDGAIFAYSSNVNFKDQLDMYLMGNPGSNREQAIVSYFAEYSLEDFEPVYLDEIKRLASENKKD